MAEIIEINHAISPLSSYLANNNELRAASRQTNDCFELDNWGARSVGANKAAAAAATADKRRADKEIARFGRRRHNRSRLQPSAAIFSISIRTLRVYYTLWSVI